MKTIYCYYRCLPKRVVVFLIVQVCLLVSSRITNSDKISSPAIDKPTKETPTLANCQVSDVSTAGDSVTTCAMNGSPMMLTTKAYLGGAIQSFKWKGVEMVDAHDHGREWQSCLNANLDKHRIQAYNPTEAGSANDKSQTLTTSTQTIKFSAAVSVDAQAHTPIIHSITHPAYWLDPSQAYAVNTTQPSEFVFDRVTKIGIYTNGSNVDVALGNVIQYITTVTTPADLKMTTRDVLTNFTLVSPAMDVTTTFSHGFIHFPGIPPFTTTSPSPGPRFIETTNIRQDKGFWVGALPVVLTQGHGNDSDIAVGLYSPVTPVCGFYWNDPLPTPTAYTLENLSHANIMGMFSKYARRAASGTNLNGQTFQATSYIVFGTFADVKSSMQTLVAQIPPPGDNCPGRGAVGTFQVKDVPFNGFFSGWALDPNAGDQSNEVEVRVVTAEGKEVSLGTTLANGPSAELNAALGYPGNHKFKISLPSKYQDGLPHAFTLYSSDLQGGPPGKIGQGTVTWRR